MQGSGPGWALQLVDRGALRTGEAHQYCLRATGGPLTVTLVWHDYPAAPSAARALVNDLDLTVRAAGLNGFPMLVRAPPGRVRARARGALVNNLDLSVRAAGLNSFPMLVRGPSGG